MPQQRDRRCGRGGLGSARHPRLGPAAHFPCAQPRLRRGRALHGRGTARRPRAGNVRGNLQSAPPSAPHGSQGAPSRCAAGWTSEATVLRTTGCARWRRGWRATPRCGGWSCGCEPAAQLIPPWSRLTRAARLCLADCDRGTSLGRRRASTWPRCTSGACSTRRWRWTSRPTAWTGGPWCATWTRSEA